MNDKNRRIEIHALKKQIVFERLILREEGKSEEEIENSLKDLQSQLSALTHQPTPHTKIEMAKSPEEALAELRQEMIRVNAKMAMLEATTAAPPQQVPQPVPNATQAAVLANFIKLQTNFHKEGNAWKIVLNNHGSNYKQWEASIDQTPMHAFCVTTTFVNNKDCSSSLTSQQEASICGLLKHTICDSHDKNVEAGGMEKPNEVFNYLKTKCSHSDRRSKIELASTLLQLANDTSPSDDFTVSKWSKNLSALTKLQVTTNELVGLMLQNTIRPPLGTDLKTFEFSMDHTLNEKEDVTKVIDSATSKLKPKAGSFDPSAMDLDKIQAFNQRPPNRYVPPHLRNTSDKQRSEQPRLNQDKAAHYRGKGQSKTPLAKYGKDCAHCEQEGHWYVDCLLYWRSVGMNEIPAPPANHLLKDSNYIPPRRKHVQQLRQVNFPNVTEGALLDSGASAHGDNTDADCKARD
ncbi:hypothetical protein Pst134EA_028130 [Puccinia striiformis f. sp. tritici]|uniref:hypothetical protein n=1 Tax=Puccinia striiformis f. sp. tritici TaxID=168172 RepID=UPI002007E19C|nr:hypothetical protein Pst134EA_028130 [Puccinia striiformis f. sp. tritici]KAH9448835.1 hypothetical protein Pst134EA_028130 [Puccinia striiformis f. sp. tritici]